LTGGGVARKVVTTLLMHPISDKAGAGIGCNHIGGKIRKYTAGEISEGILNGKGQLYKGVFVSNTIELQAAKKNKIEGHSNRSAPLKGFCESFWIELTPQIEDEEIPPSVQVRKELWPAGTDTEIPGRGATFSPSKGGCAAGKFSKTGTETKTRCLDRTVRGAY